MFGRFTKNIKPHVEAELAIARIANNNGDSVLAFKHLENAHVLGQESTYFHVKVHFLMLCWAIKEHDLRELLGQVFRIVGAATKTAFGFIPSGNTGGSNVSPFKVMPISLEHENHIARAKTGLKTR